MDYDYVIVGGGSAGSVLANRLTARAGNRVLLIEAGMDTPPGKVPSDILEMFPVAALNPAYKWMKLLAYTQSLRRNYPRPPTPVLYDQGKVMGGGSSVNYQAANRGAPADYDEWAELGAAGWGWKDVLPYFRKLEDDADFDGEFHGKGGPIPVQRMKRQEWSGYSNAAARALETAGLRYLHDQNGTFVDGYFPATQNNRGGKRVSAAMAYLDDEVRRRPNLSILSKSHVLALMFEGRKAVGATVQTPQGVETVRAREIILATGAVHSPAMLMRSGIGPAAQLSALGIGVLQDLPGVGDNLRDHPGVGIMAYVTSGARVDMASRPLQLSFRYSSKIEDCPPSDMFTAVFCRGGWHGVGRRLGMAMTWVNKSFSSGRVSLQSTNPHDEPKVELNFFDDQRDLTRLKDGLRFLGALFDSAPMKEVTRSPFGGRLSQRAREASAVNVKNAVKMGAAGMLLDGPAKLRDAIIRNRISEAPELSVMMSDDGVLEEFVRSTAMGIKHLSCTCRMGEADDPKAVTLTDGTVKGVGGLRVVDASIMPNLPRCNTNLTTLMIAEKMSDKILAS
ncbi:MAG TPA: GMC family oxidoreductase N-terminal domain-containing protein [Stellaceae bacterium]|nr:GMC family oxidoreductase N-terminal domain-containing protein [Stellaceae bacterium]